MDTVDQSSRRVLGRPPHRGPRPPGPRASAGLAAAEAQLQSAEERWLTLETQHEAIAQQG